MEFLRLLQKYIDTQISHVLSNGRVRNKLVVMKNSNSVTFIKPWKIDLDTPLQTRFYNKTLLLTYSLQKVLLHHITSTVDFFFSGK